MEEYYIVILNTNFQMEYFSKKNSEGGEVLLYSKGLRAEVDLYPYTPHKSYKEVKNKDTYTNICNEIVRTREKLNFVCTNEDTLVITKEVMDISNSMNDLINRFMKKSSDEVHFILKKPV